jgi:hypothetical protein
VSSSSKGENELILNGGRQRKVDVKKLDAIIKELKKDLGDGLLATDIWTTADGQIIVGLNPQPAAAALFNRMTVLINDALKGSKFPLLNRYFLVHLEGGHIGMSMPLRDYQWGVLLDAKKAQLGLILNVVVPKTIDAIKEAVD